LFTADLPENIRGHTQDGEKNAMNGDPEMSSLEGLQWKALWEQLLRLQRLRHRLQSSRENIV